jgi:hypothetical protein
MMELILKAIQELGLYQDLVFQGMGSRQQAKN